MGRFTSHGEVCYEPSSKGRLVHNFWGDYRQWWPGEARPDTGGGNMGCGSCPQTGPAPSFASVEEWLQIARSNPSDFHEHLETLRDLTAGVEVAVELSQWYKPALLALAAGYPKVLRSYCPGAKPEWVTLKSLLAGQTDFAGVQADSLQAEPIASDVLFIDTLHQADRLYAELQRWAPLCRQRVIIHCTVIFGETGDNGGPGVLHGIRRFLGEHPNDWFIEKKYDNNNGLMVLARHAFLARPLTPAEMNPVPTLEEEYKRHLAWDSPIHEHLPVLRELAAQCKDVVEFGVDTGSSTVALLAGQPETLTSYDTRPAAQASYWQTLAGRTRFRFEQNDSRKIAPAQCDLLFIDTHHVADVLWEELCLHAPGCRRWIVLHDTVSFGEIGEQGRPGLLPAVRRYLKEHPEWTSKFHHRNNNGLLCLTRDPADKKDLPPLWKQGWNVLKASWRAGENVLKDFGPLAGAEAQEKRLELCVLCKSRTNCADGANQCCAECGCPLERKTSWPQEFCPLGLWHQEEKAIRKQV